MKLKEKAEKISNNGTRNLKWNLSFLIHCTRSLILHTIVTFNVVPGSIPTTALDPSKYPPTILIEEIVSMIQKDPPMMGIQSMLKELGITVLVQFLEVVLKLSYRTGTKALKFFHWVVRKLDRN